MGRLLAICATAQPLADDGPAPTPVTIGGSWTSGHMGSVFTVRETIAALRLLRAGRRDFSLRAQMQSEIAWLRWSRLTDHAPRACHYRHDAPNTSMEEGPMAWESLGGRIVSAPAATSWAAEELQVFAIQADGAMWNRYWDGRRWHDWESLGGELVGDPAACSWGADRIDLFARGADGSLQHCWYEPGGWTGWESLGGELASDPAAESWGPKRLDVFARGPKGDLLHAWWDGTAWSWDT